MDRWEYTIADLTEVKKNIEELNRLGAEGREAVGMVSTWGLEASSLCIRSRCSSGA